MITGISIENFKLFGKRVDIELAPITLLFGRNSSGKSSVLQALEYARQVVVDADPTASGQLLGGFRSILHRGKGAAELAITMRVTPSDQALVQHLQMAQSPGGEEISALKLENFEYTLRVRLDTDYQRSFVSEYAVGIPGQPVLAVTASAGPRKTVLWADVRIDETDFDIESPWFPLDITDLVIAGQRPHAELVQPWLSGEPRNMAPEHLSGCPNLAHWPSALPCRPFEVDYDGDELEFPALVTGHAALNKALLGSRALLGEYLSAIRHIGPIRVLPPRGLVDFGWPKPADWYDGSAAWALMQRDPHLATREVGPVLITMGSGYRIVSNEMAVVDDPGTKAKDLRAYSREPEGAKRVADLADDLEILPRTRGFHISDDRTYTRVHPRDVGVGVSQLIPVIAAAVAEREPQPDGSSRPIGFVAIEQPELHVHPAVQSNLGSLFAEMIRGAEGELSGRQFLIETHSEHLVLRLLRLIRETTEQGEAYGGPKLRPEDVAIYYFDQVEGEAVVTRIRIDEDGEFIDKWPQGFFNERLKEL